MIRECPEAHATAILAITYYIVSESNGAEGDEGEVEAFSVTPTFHITEDHWWENQKQQCPNCEEESHGQSLHHLRNKRFF